MAAAAGTKEVNKHLSVLLTLFLEGLGLMGGEKGRQGLTMGLTIRTSTASRRCGMISHGVLWGLKDNGGSWQDTQGVITGPGTQSHLCSH